MKTGGNDCSCEMGFKFFQFTAGWLAQRFGYRRTIVGMCLGNGAVMLATFSRAQSFHGALIWFAFIGVFPGLVCAVYQVPAAIVPNLAAHHGSQIRLQFRPNHCRGRDCFFGLFTKVGDVRQALCYTALLFPAPAIATLWLPKIVEERLGTAESAFQ